MASGKYSDKWSKSVSQSLSQSLSERAGKHNGCQKSTQKCPNLLTKQKEEQHKNLLQNSITLRKMATYVLTLTIPKI